MIPTLELDGIPILFNTLKGAKIYEVPKEHFNRINELGDRISYGEWPKNDYPLRGHMLIVSLEKLREFCFERTT